MTTQTLASALALIKAGRAAEAVALLTRLTREHPEHLEVHYTLGHALEALQRWPEAGRAWRAASSLAAETKPAADVDQIISAMEEGLSSVRISFDSSDIPDVTLSDNEVVTETWARILAGQQQYEEAARVYQELAERDPEQAARYREKALRMQKRAQGEA